MSLQILLTAAAREESIIELQVKPLEAYMVTVPLTTPDGKAIEGEFRSLTLGYVPVIGKVWARMTFKASEIVHIADANAYMYERTDGEWDKLSVVELQDNTIFLVRSKYEELRAVLYGVSHTPILNVTTN